MFKLEVEFGIKKDEVEIGSWILDKKEEVEIGSWTWDFKLNVSTLWQ